MYTATSAAPRIMLERENPTRRDRAVLLSWGSTSLDIGRVWRDGKPFEPQNWTFHPTDLGGRMGYGIYSERLQKRLIEKLGAFQPIQPVGYIADPGY